MTRRRILVNILLLVALSGLSYAPLLIGGMLFKQQAERALSDEHYLEAARYYELAGLRLLGADALWEEAGQAALLGGDADGAIHLFNQAQSLSSNARLSLGDAYWQTNQSEKAKVIWQEMLDADLVSVPLYERFYSMHFNAGDYGAAVEDLEALISLDPVNADAHYRLGLLLAATQPDQALPELMQAASLDAQLDPPVQVLRANLNQALLDDDRAYQLVVSGRGLAAINDWSLAAEAFRNALVVDPHYPEAAAWLGEATYQLGQDGYPYLQMALVLDPESAVVHVFTGLYWQRIGREDSALQEFTKAASLEPSNPAWQILVGDASARSGDVESALVAYKKAVAMAPTEADYLQTLAIFCAQYNIEVDETALPTALRLVALAPDDWQSWDVLGQVALTTGNLEEAERFLLKALQMAPEEAALHIHLGVLYLQKNEPVSAYDHLIRARNDDPQGVYGIQAQRLLERYFP